MSASLGPILAAWTFARPVWLWALLLLVPLTILHLYRRRRLVVPFLPLLVEAVGPRRSGGGWHRLREILSLVLRAGALIALVLVLAGLGPAEEGEKEVALFVVVDADVTTSAVESDGKTRYRHGLALARAAVRADTWAEVAVLEAREHPEVIVQATVRRDEAAEHLDRRIAEVDAGRRAAAIAPGDLGAALDLARSLAAGRADARVLVLTARPLPEPPSGETSVDVWGMGRTSEDQGLVAFDVVVSPDGATAEVHASVRNDADVVGPRDLIVALGETEAARRPLAVPPGETADVVLDLDVPREGGWLRVFLEGDDAFVANDAATAWLSPAARPSVLVVRAAGAVVRPYTQAILEAMGDTIDVEESGSVGVADLGRAEPRDVVLVDGAALPEGALRGGSWLFLAPLAGALPFEVGSPLVHPLVWRSAPDHALVRDLDLGTAYVARGYPIRGEGVIALAEADGQIVLAEGERGGVRYVALGLDPEGSDLALRAALPLLVRNAIRRLAAQPTRPLAPFYRAGEVLRPRLPLPHGPEVSLRVGRYEEAARLAPEGAAWEVPSGWAGEVEIETRGSGDVTWIGRTGFVDVDPERSIRPVRAAHAEPPARRSPPAEDARWRHALLAFALLCLLADLVVMAGRGRPSSKLAGGLARG